jgi:hypothetical protein
VTLQFVEASERPHLKEEISRCAKKVARGDEPFISRNCAFLTFPKSAWKNNVTSTLTKRCPKGSYRIYELFGSTNGNANVNEIELQMLPAGTDLN